MLLLVCLRGHEVTAENAYWSPTNGYAECRECRYINAMAGKRRRGVKPMVPMPERFWIKVRKTQRCWIWTAGKDRNGYGTFKGDDLGTYAHRVAYQLEVGPIPDGLGLDHLCRNRSCVRPSHLEPVTQRENTMRGMSPAATNAAKTHCRRGHPYDEANTYIRPGTRNRQCRECHRAATRESARRHYVPVSHR